MTSPNSPPTAPQTHSSAPSTAPSTTATNPEEMERGRPTAIPKRPGLGQRKSSGTIIIPRDSPTVDVHEHYDANDARAMSPRRSGDEISKLGDDARHALEEQARALQENLLEIIDRVDSVKSEHEKLEGGNKFLQSYIGELMQTSKITSAGAAPRRKGTAK